MISFDKSVIGMIHVPALPGTPSASLPTASIIDLVLNDADQLVKAGVDMLMLENMHDTPYLKREVGPEIIATMSVLGAEVKRTSNVPCGVQVLAGANEGALAVALSAGLDFIRAEGFVYGHLADEGYMDAVAGPLLRYRKQIGAEHIAILTDIKKKHSSHMLTADVDLEETARTAEFFGSNGIIITGQHTGMAAAIDEVERIASIVRGPLLIGSGLTDLNIEQYFSHADAFIVGSFLKKEGQWFNDLDPQRLNDFMSKVRILKSSN